MTKTRDEAWKALALHPDPTLAQLFADDAERVSKLSARLELDETGILFDWSKTHLTDDLLSDFEALAQASEFDEMRRRLFTGQVVNPTENRAAEHSALRGVGLETSVEEAEALRHRMKLMVEAVHGGALGEVKHLIHVGIGGSALGPALAVDALGRDAPKVDVHVVSNIDGVALEEAFDACDPATTLIAVASKTFTTIETMTNAQSALKWLADNGVEDPTGRVIALTAAPEKAVEWGVDETRILPFAESVGGRYSLWSSIGFPVAISIGWREFEQVLAGAARVDEHFRDTNGRDNLPLRAAFSDLYYLRLRGCQTRAVFAYDERLRLLPDYLQQLEMESNGKSTLMDGTTAPYHMGPVVWGAAGTNGQHAFYQLIHQGTRVIPCEFLIAANGHEPDLTHHHKLLIANCLAQSEALMRGRSLQEASEMMAAKGLSGAELDRQARHRVFPGNRPSTTLSYPLLDPFTLGQIIALYEHRVFVEGVILGINSYDQWGVELGKELATSLQPIVEGAAPATDKDGSTAALVAFIAKHAD